MADMAQIADLEISDSYYLFCEHMQRYENGERSLNAEEREFEEYLAADGTAFRPLEFSVFLENMRRYEAGERELNKEEKEWTEYIASIGDAFPPLSFDTFLSNMERYQREKASGKQK